MLVSHSFETVLERHFPSARGGRARATSLATRPILCGLPLHDDAIGGQLQPARTGRMDLPLARKSPPTRTTKRVVSVRVPAAGATLAGGGDDNFRKAAPAGTDQVPASVSQSLGVQRTPEGPVIACADMPEPVDVSAVTGPVDDTSERDFSI